MTPQSPATPTRAPVKRRTSFVERTIVSLSGAMEQALFAEELAKGPGLLQQLDPRVKVLGLLSLIIAVALARNILVILALFAIACGLAFASHVPVRGRLAGVWKGVLLFTGVLAVPAIFITPGRLLYRLPLLHWPITAQGVAGASYLITRVETATTLSVLLVICTPWTEVLKALRVLRVPVVFVVILGMTYRYIFVLLQTARDMFESRQSRMVGRLDAANRRRVAAASVGVLLSKSLQLSSDVYLAMQSRGFRGEVYTLDNFKMQRRDWLALGGFFLVAIVAIWLGRGN